MRLATRSLIVHDVALVGNGLPDRMQHEGWLETLLQNTLEEQQLTIRNLSASGDRVIAPGTGFRLCVNSILDGKIGDRKMEDQEMFLSGIFLSNGI